MAYTFIPKDYSWSNKLRRGREEEAAGLPYTDKEGKLKKGSQSQLVGVDKSFFGKESQEQLAALQSYLDAYLRIKATQPARATAPVAANPGLTDFLKAVSENALRGEIGAYQKPFGEQPLGTAGARLLDLKTMQENLRRNYNQYASPQAPAPATMGWQKLLEILLAFHGQQAIRPRATALTSTAPVPATPMIPAPTVEKYFSPAPPPAAFQPQLPPEAFMRSLDMLKYFGGR